MSITNYYRRIITNYYVYVSVNYYLIYQLLHTNYKY